jgi:hypothetical protein
VNWDEVRARRLARNHLAKRAPRSKLVDVVRDVGGLQAQILTAAEIGLGIRVDRVTQAEIRAALWETRTLVKTWSLRNTLHLVPADEVTMWTAARRAIGDPWHAAWELDAKKAERLLRAFADALDGRALERQELAEDVAARVGGELRERLLSQWGDLVSLGVYGDVVCFGANRGAKVTFVRPDQWLGRHEPRDSVESLREVCRRYVAAYGPALPQSFTAWFGCGLKPAQARELFDALEVEPVDVEGKTMWVLRGDTHEAQTSAIRLVPQYDAYVMGFRERERFVPDEAKPGMGFEGVAGSSWLLVDGVIAGGWTRTKQGKRLAIEVTPFAPVPRAQVEAEAERIAETVGLELSLIVR